MSKLAEGKARQGSIEGVIECICWGAGPVCLDRARPGSDPLQTVVAVLTEKLYRNLQYIQSCEHRCQLMFFAPRLSKPASVAI